MQNWSGNWTVFSIITTIFRGSVYCYYQSEWWFSPVYKYDDYGKGYKKGGAKLANPFQYIGREGVQTDDSDLYFMKARIINTLGRSSMKSRSGW